MLFVEQIQRLGRVEQVYSLNPKGGRLNDGTPIYRNLREVPGEVDYLISAVPASAILDLIDDAIAKGVKVIHLFTAGFGETGDGERIELEAALVAKVQEAGIRLIGPNCMGIHSPISGVSWMGETASEPGRVGVLSQSGMNAGEIVIRGERRAIRFSYVVSYGNATDLNECDYLDYLAGNDETDIVLGYIEGVKDGPRFVRSARRLTQRKPLVILKGGVTAAGSRAASSHTGSLAGSSAIWEAVSKQAGFINATSIEELLDLAVTIQHLSAVSGPRAGIVGGGGGSSVLAADSCDRLGIDVPWLSAATQERLAAITPVAGSSVRNPVDTQVLWGDGDFAETMQAVADDPNVDFVILHFPLDARPSRQRNAALQDEFEPRLLRNLDAVKAALAKPLAVVMMPPRTVAGMEITLRLRQELGDRGFGVFSSVDDCARAVRRYLDWKQRRRGA